MQEGARAYNLYMLYAGTDEGLLLVCFVDGECTRGYGKEGGNEEGGRKRVGGKVKENTGNVATYLR